jgi:hypothetical protein
MNFLYHQENLAAALSLAEVGFRIFPAKAIYNSANQRWNKPPHIADWQSLASTDPNQIRYWWKQFPDAIPAICCDDFVVIDADRHAGGPDGVAALAELAAHYCEWPDHPKVLTPGNGEHSYFGQSNPILGNRTGQLPPGIDVRGNGGFVIGVGAVLPDGTEWRLAPDHSADLPQLPPWLDTLIRANKVRPVNSAAITGQSTTTKREEKYAESALEACVNEIATAPKGKRNTTLNNVAYRLGRMIARSWIDRDKVENCLLYAAFQLKNEDGLAAVLATIKSGIDAGRLNPHPDLTNRKRGGN